MSRLKNFSRNLATSYLQLGVNVTYSLISVPLILHWLPKQEFGLWALLVQLLLYMNLLDLGMNQAVARFLVDHKDRRSDGNYGSLLKVSFLVGAIQGLAILAAVLLAAPWLTEVLKVPAENRQTFIDLLRIQGVVSALSYCANPLQILLNAHQRMDIVSRQSIIGMVLSLGLLVVFLTLNCGIYSFIYSNAIVALIAPCDYLWQCRRLGFLPHAGEWGKVTWRRFKELFFYGKDVFLFHVGVMLITASPTIVIAYALGLETAAIWTVGTKIFLLIRLLVIQPYGAAAPALYEMHARDEVERLRARFQNVVLLCASLGAFLGVSFVLCNSLFVTVWTSGKIGWSPLNDVLLAVWLLFSSFQMPHCSFVSVTKQIGGLRYLFFLEGCAIVLLSLALASRWSLPGIILSLVVCVLTFSYPYGLWRGAVYFNTRFRHLAIQWVAPSLKLVAIYAPLAAAIWFSTLGIPVFWRLTIHAVFAGMVGGLLFLRIGLPRDMINEVRSRLPRSALVLFDRVFSKA
jgi:O-antigen/teichoic acid export membrane protein